MEPSFKAADNDDDNDNDDEDEAGDLPVVLVAATYEVDFGKKELNETFSQTIITISGLLITVIDHH